MHIVIAGIGKIGSQLANKIATYNNSVAVIDIDENNFTKLTSDLEVKKIHGQCFDKEVLVQAGIEKCDIFLALTSEDSANLISARIAKDTFKVPEVIAKIKDTLLSQIATRYDIETISTLNWELNKLLYLVNKTEVETKIVDVNNGVGIKHISLNSSWEGKNYQEIAAQFRLNFAYINRNKKNLFKVEELKLQPNDEVYVFTELNSPSKLDSTKLLTTLSENENLT